MESEELTFSDLLSLVRRRFAVFANSFIALLSISVLLAFGLPSVYESTGTILIEQQDIPDDLVQSTITSYADERIQVISQRVMSTDNLAGLIQRHNLYDYGQDDESIGAKVAKLKDRILIEPISADVFNQASGRPAQATIAFTVTVQHEAPEVARDLATEVTDLFLEENRRSRAEQTLETVSFLESQSAAYQGEIDRIDGEIAGFKSRYQGMLPENVSFNLQALEREERQLIDIKGEIRTLEERIRYLQDERRMSMLEAGGAIDRMAELQEE
ncbi:MAG: lipopolysaccharide biosynthesis protein, partial [Woeseiaceae bacterium]